MMINILSLQKLLSIKRILQVHYIFNYYVLSLFNLYHIFQRDVTVFVKIYLNNFKSSDII